jgi:molybdenum cofactor cytidylyltransferase
MSPVCAILAAGRSERMGVQKLLLPFGGTTLLGRALDAAAELPTVVVATEPIALHVPSRANVRVVINDEPGRGMAHSLALANAALGAPESPLVVLLADTPLVSASLVLRVVAARGDADVAYPVRKGVGGHPVVFGPHVRAALETLSDGDTLRVLRGDPRWLRLEVPIDDEAPYADVDTPADLERARRLFEAALEPAEVSRSHGTGE